jgi:endonuclease/exonuclease/phosphatase family metal-dependent hydrolase
VTNINQFSAKTKNHALPHAPNAEPRVALEIQVELANNRKILFVGTHLDHCPLFVILELLP